MAWFEHGTSRIYYEEFGNGDPVLLLPGWAGSLEELTPISDALASRFHIITADLPGSGRSEPQPRAYPVRYLEEDAHAFIALLNHLKTGPTHLLGFSDGGEVALLMAILSPALARSVLVWGAAGYFGEDAQPLLDMFSQVVDHPPTSMQGFSTYLKAKYGEANARAMIGHFVTAMRGIVSEGGDISRSRADKISSPVLLIVGEKDPIATPALVEALAARIPDAEVREIAGVGHNVHHEQTEWLVKTISDWLADQ